VFWLSKNASPLSSIGEAFAVAGGHAALPGQKDVRTHAIIGAPLRSEAFLLSKNASPLSSIGEAFAVADKSSPACCIIYLCRGGLIPKNPLASMINGKRFFENFKKILPPCGGGRNS
jgi:hypothetical protein